jgi:hypothetical protein
MWNQIHIPNIINIEIKTMNTKKLFITAIITSILLSIAPASFASGGKKVKPFAHEATTESTIIGNKDSFNLYSSTFKF